MEELTSLYTEQNRLTDAVTIGEMLLNALTQAVEYGGTHGQTQSQLLTLGLLFFEQGNYKELERLDQNIKRLYERGDWIFEKLPSWENASKGNGMEEEHIGKYQIVQCTDHDQSQ
jgi:hypothetical protein